MLPGGQHGVYGSTSGQAEPVKKRRRANVVGAVLAYLLPCGTFVGTFTLLSYWLHAQHPGLCWFVDALVGTIVLLCGLTALPAFRQLHAGARAMEPSLHAFAFATILLGFVLGTLLGCVNYAMYMEPYYDMVGLSTYPSIDTSKVAGQQVLDAGRVVFTRGSVLDVNRSAGYKSGRTFCVAPIVSTADRLLSYDFWAVGVDCCSSDKPDFHCGTFSNPMVHAGLRMVDESKQPYFMLAVQQAKIKHGLNAFHPLFFEWTEDPLAKTGVLQESAWRFYVAAVAAFCVGQFALEAGLLYAVSKASLGDAALNY